VAPPLLHAARTSANTAMRTAIDETADRWRRPGGAGD
jgi:hypothetical protein